MESFLRSAKTSFIRLQAANDRKDLNDIREYTTPEMFAEVSMQLQERGDAPQKTDVVAVNAELLEVNHRERSRHRQRAHERPVAREQRRAGKLRRDLACAEEPEGQQVSLAAGRNSADLIPK